MSFVDKFMSHYSGHQDYSKTSKFEVLIFAPPALTGTLKNPEGLKFQCETSELPGYNINTVDGKVYGAHYAVAATPVFNDLNLTFICAGDLWEKQFFDSWMDYIMPKGDYGYFPQYRQSYVAPIQVRSYLETPSTPSLFGLLDKTNSAGQPYLEIGPKIAYEAKFVEAFPTSVAPVTLNWADDGINRLNVTFKYKRWEKMNSENTVNAAVNIFGAKIQLPTFTNPFKY
jgi:hypothetical protein